MIVGICGLIIPGLCLVAVVLGHLALSAIKKSVPSLKGRGMAISGLILGYLVTAVLIAMAIIFITTITNQVKRTENTRVRTDFHSLNSVLRVYEMESGTYPTTDQGLMALVEVPTMDPVPVKWMRLMNKVPTDPWSMPYLYRFPGSKDPTTFEILSMGPDRMENTADDLSSQD